MILWELHHHCSRWTMMMQHYDYNALKINQYWVYEFYISDQVVECNDWLVFMSHDSVEMKQLHLARLAGWCSSTLEDDKVHRTVWFSNRPLRPRSANIQQRFLFKTVDPTPSTNFIIHPVESHATVVDWIWSKFALRSNRNHKSLRMYMCIRFLT